MGAAEMISFEEVRARKQWDALRRPLHARFDQWLDGLAEQLHEPEPTLAQGTETGWHLRHALTGGLTATSIAHAHQGEYTRRQVACPQGDGRLTARAPVPRTVETMGGPVQLKRPYFSCRPCCCGLYPREEVVGCTAGCIQLDVHKAAAKLVTAVPSDEAQTLWRALTGVSVGSERMPMDTPQAATQC